MKDSPPPALPARDPAGRSEAQRIRGLDSIRFVCAFWVVLSHLKPPEFLLLEQKTTLAEKLYAGLLGNSFVGVCAVIAFFVISGFCIHFPRAAKLNIPSMGEYLVRRYFRVCIPLFAGIAAAAVLDVDLHGLILWSLYAEMIYYAFYPGFLAIRRRLGSWNQMIAVGFVGALMVAGFFHGSASDFHDPGVFFTWILGLPCWLLGCLLAEISQKDDKPARNIWLWRGAVWCASVVCSVLRFHTPIKYVWTLPPFGVLVAFWVLMEVRHFRRNAPPAFLEWAGNWSYSLYLVHMLAYALYEKSGMAPRLGVFGWFVQTAAVLVLSYAFAVIFEFPSHQLAKKVSNYFRSRGPAKGAA